jgi:hypothetical protein
MGPNPVGLVSLEEEEIRTQTHPGDHVRTQGRDSHLQAEERGLSLAQDIGQTPLFVHPGEVEGPASLTIDELHAWRAR